MLLYVKIFLILRFIYSTWKYRVGKSSGANLKEFIVDYGYLFFVVYLLWRFESITSFYFFIDILIIVSMVFCLKEMAFILKMYIKTKDFGLNPEKRIFSIVEYYLSKNLFEKANRILRSHINHVKINSKLLIYLGDSYVNLKKYEEAYSSFVEATEYTDDEDLLILAAQKAFKVCAQDIKDFDSAKAFIEGQIIKDVSARHICELEKLIKPKV